MTYRSHTTPVLSSATTAVVNSPSGMVAGDAVLLVLANFGGNNGNIDSVSAVGTPGSTSTTQLQFDTETFEWSQLWFGWVLASDQTSWKFTASRAMTSISTAIAFSNMSGSPTDGTGTINKDGGTGAASPVTVTATGITTTATDSLIWMGVSAPSTSNIITGFSVPAGFTQLFTTDESASKFMTLTVGYKSDQPSGATGNLSGSITLSGGTSGFVAGLMAFIQAASGTTGNSSRLAPDSILAPDLQLLC